jgi:hypothetical protein
MRAHRPTGGPAPQGVTAQRSALYPARFLVPFPLLVVVYVLALRADLTWLWLPVGLLLVLSYVSFCVAAARVIGRGRVLRRGAAVSGAAW